MPPNDPIVRVLLTLVPLVLSIGVHEFAHAWAAWKLGDDTAARQGRLTLNPLAHADPLGTFVLPSVFALMGSGGFGWGKPVPYVPTNLSRRFSMRAGEAIVAFAGPASNLLLAIICGGLYVGFAIFQVIGQGSAFDVLLQRMLLINLVLFFFNLIPVPPLDGSKIFSWALGQRVDGALDAISAAGPVSLIAVVLLGGYVISPAVNVMAGVIINGFLHLLG